MRIRTRVIACLLLAVAFGVHAETRVALVIGNARYEGGTWPALANPAHDAQAIAVALRKVGFQVVGCGSAGVCLDLTREAMENALREFGRDLQSHPGAIAFIYYSGHGLQARRNPQASDENFLIPVRSGIREQFDVVSYAVPQQRLLDVLNAVGVKVGIVVLDACRVGGPLAKSAKGLQIVGAAGLLIGYSAGAGQEAQDTGLYAQALASQLVISGVEISDVFRSARVQVIAATKGAQQPEFLDGLNDRLYLANVLPQPPAASASSSAVSSSSYCEVVTLEGSRKARMCALHGQTSWQSEKDQVACLFPETTMLACLEARGYSIRYQ